MPLVRDGQGEIVIVDSGSTDRTLEIARARGAKVFVEPWKGFAAQKNSAMDKASGDWVLQLDADEALEPELTEEIAAALRGQPAMSGYWIPRKNFFLGAGSGMADSIPIPSCAWFVAARVDSWSTGRIPP